MRKLLILAIAVLALVLSSAHAVAEKRAFECGTAYSVSDEDGTLLLQHHGAFSLINVGSDAMIRDGGGKLLSLGDIRRGDWIEYWHDTAKVATPVTTRRISVNARPNRDCAAPQVLGQR